MANPLKCNNMQTTDVSLVQMDGRCCRTPFLRARVTFHESLGFKLAQDRSRSVCCKCLSVIAHRAVWQCVILALWIPKGPSPLLNLHCWALNPCWPCISINTTGSFVSRGPAACVCLQEHFCVCLYLLKCTYSASECVCVSFAPRCMPVVWKCWNDCKSTRAQRPIQRVKPKRYKWNSVPKWKLCFIFDPQLRWMGSSVFHCWSVWRGCWCQQCVQQHRANPPPGTLRQITWWVRSHSWLMKDKGTLFVCHHKWSSEMLAVSRKVYDRILYNKVEHNLMDAAWPPIWF